MLKECGSRGGLTSLWEPFWDADKQITEKIVNGGLLIETSVLDHIIIGDDRFIPMQMKDAFNI
jgi:DNA repair protein RadC